MFAEVGVFFVGFEAAGGAGGLAGVGGFDEAFDQVADLPGNDDNAGQNH